MPRAASRPLLAAKLLVPPPRSGVVLRARLHERLRNNYDTRLTTVVAPAGWGKTTLLSAWATDPEEPRRICWLSLDETDNEPVRFWTYALSALSRVAPELTRDPLATLSAPGLDPVELALSALLNELTQAHDHYVLVLEDYHVITEPAIHENVEFLLSYLPPTLHLVISSRADPPLPLARMRARGVLTEVRLDDLRCTAKEAAELVAAVASVPTAATDGLVTRTEGWAAGLQLAALALRGAADPAKAAAAVSGDQRHILDYFEAEVLPSLNGVQRDLLVHSSVLERLSGPLCDAVLHTSGSAAVLEELERRDLFVTPLGQGWYRCHRLFRDVLRRELDTVDPNAAAVSLERAAAWFAAQDRIDEAVAHRLAAADDEGALELIRTQSRWFLDHGAMASLLSMGERVAPAVRDPHLDLTLAFAAGLSGKPERAVAWLEVAEPLINDDSPPLTGWRSLRAGADTTWATYGLGDDQQAALALASRAVQLENDPAYWGYVVARSSLGGVLLRAGQVAEAVDLLREAWQAPSRGQLPPLLVLQFAGQLALCHIELGELDAARTVIAEVIDEAAEAERAWGPGAAAAVAVLRLAEARIVAASDPKSAVAALERCVELAEAWGVPSVIISALTSLAKAQWATGERTAARRSVDRARDVVAMERTPGLAVRQLDEFEARIGRSASTSLRSQGALDEDLTDRELAVLRALRGPLSAREIAGELYLSINTVKGYTKSLYRKLGVVTRAEAVHRAHDLGLI